MVNLITVSVKDLDKLLSILESSGYGIVYGPHSVLLDNSEIEEINLVKEDVVKATIVVHYISQYYKAVIDSEGLSDEDVLKALLKAKYSNRKWRVPVNPVAIITSDRELIEILDSYRDDYPCEEACRYLNIYLNRHPDARRMFSGLLASVLERIYGSQ